MHDTTLTINNVTSPKQETLSLETFKFVGNETRVYLHCEVLVCNASDPSSRCRQGCLKSGRRKRDESQSTYISKDLLSAGPVQMVETVSGKTARTSMFEYLINSVLKIVRIVWELLRAVSLVRTEMLCWMERQAL